MSAMDAFFPPPGKQPRCHTFASDVSVHWYATPDAETCMCGEVERKRGEKTAGE